MADALYGPSHSRNSAIACACTPRLHDPQLVLYTHVTLAARRFSTRSDAAARAGFCKLVSRHSGLSHQCRGPAGTLRYYLDKMGWGCDKFGNLDCSTFIAWRLWNTCQVTLKLWLRRMWDQQFSERRALRGLPAINTTATCQIIRQLPETKWRTVVNEGSGAFQTRSQQAFWDSSVSPTCAHCPEVDARTIESMSVLLLPR